MINFGAVPIGAVLPIMWGSYAAATGASATLSGLAVTDIEIYKGTSMTQRASDAGYTLLDTDGIDLDGTTGINGFSVDTGDNTDAGFFTAGSFFNVVVSSVTIDGQTVNFVVATFRLVAAENTAGVPVSDATRIAGAVQSASNVGELANRLATLLEAAPGSPSEFRFTADALARVLTALGMSAGNLDAQFSAVRARQGIIDEGRLQAATATTAQLRAGLSTGDDRYIGATLAIVAGTGSGQSRVVNDHDNGSDTVTVDAPFNPTPDNTSDYQLYYGSPAPTVPPEVTFGGAPAATIAKLDSMLEVASGSPTDYRFSVDALRRVLGAVGMAEPNLDQQLTRIDGRLDTEIPAIKQVTDKLHSMLEAAPGSPSESRFTADAVQRVQTVLGVAAANLDAQIAAVLARLPAALIGGRIDATVGAMQANVMTAAAAAADLTTELQTGLATAAVLASVLQVTDKLHTMLQVAPGSPNEFRFTEDALELAPAGGGGGGGGTDWSVGEREQIRYRLGIDGSATAPSANPSLATDADVAAVLVIAQALATLLEVAPGSPGDYRLSRDALANVPASSGGGGGLDAAGVRAAIGMASANLDAQLAALPTALENADALLDRDMSAVAEAGGGARTVLQALRILRNRWVISGATQSIKKEDDTTESWSQTLGTTPGADPVTSTDPA